MTLFHILSLILFYHVSRQQSIVFALSSLYYCLKKNRISLSFLYKLSDFLSVLNHQRFLIS